MESNSICRNCSKNKMEADLLDPIFRLNCDECVTDRTEVARSEWIIRTEAVLFSCGPCWASYTAKQPLVPHDCPREDVFTCTQCGQQLYSEDDLSKHTKYLHRSRSELCWMCGENIVNSGEHICGRKVTVKGCDELESSTVAKKVSEQKQPPLKSKKCKESLVLSGEKRYRCEICMKGFTASGSLRTHIRSHTGEKPYKCQICLKGFTRPGHLKTHIHTHTGESPYKCQICLKVLSNSCALKVHTRTHTGEKPYKCQICEMRFSVNSTLKSHMRTHTGEIPYKCQICLRVLSSSCALKVHTRTHTGEKPYKCQICMKGFRAAGLLTNHIRTHTGEKLYNCNICEKRFSLSSNLKKHMSTHLQKKQ